MRVLYDTNIILDLLLNREPFCENSARVIDLSANKLQLLNHKNFYS